jgi:septum formation protein
MPSPRLILASSSPHRRDLLRQAGFAPLIHPSHFDESPLESAGLAPADLAMRLASAKAAIIAPLFPDDLVLAADTVVALADRTIGKAADAAQARQILTCLSGTTHQVITAVVVLGLSAKFHAAQCVTSSVRMLPLTPAQIDAYIATNDWQGKAGAYGIQDNDPLVEMLTGCRTNIVGLPMTTVFKILSSAGLSPSPIQP